MLWGALIAEQCVNLEAGAGIDSPSLVEIDMNIAIGIVIGLAFAAGAFGLWVLVNYAKGMSR